MRDTTTYIPLKNIFHPECEESLVGYFLGLPFGLGEVSGEPGPFSFPSLSIISCLPVSRKQGGGKRSSAGFPRRLDLVEMCIRDRCNHLHTNYLIIHHFILNLEKSKGGPTILECRPEKYFKIFKIKIKSFTASVSLFYSHTSYNII